MGLFTLCDRELYEQFRSFMYVKNGLVDSVRIASSCQFLINIEGYMCGIISRSSRRDLQSMTSRYRRPALNLGSRNPHGNITTLPRPVASYSRRTYAACVRRFSNRMDHTADRNNLNVAHPAGSCIHPSPFPARRHTFEWGPRSTSHGPFNLRN